MGRVESRFTEYKRMTVQEGEKVSGLHYGIWGMLPGKISNLGTSDFVKLHLQLFR